MPVDVWAIDGLTLSGLETRQTQAATVMADGTALGSRSGVRPGDPGLTVTLSGSTITVSAGVATVAYSGQGVYRAAFPTATGAGTVTAAHASLTRIDLVYLRIWDSTVDASGLYKADVVYLAGTPSSTPSAPTPAGTVVYMPLATITVPPSGGGSASVSTAVRPYTVAPGGILPAAAAPSAPYVGQYYDDGTSLRRWNGSSWRTVSPLTPQVSDQVGFPASPVVGNINTDFTSGEWPPLTIVVPPSGMVRITIGAAVNNTNGSTSTAWAVWRASGALTEGASEKVGVSAAGSRTYASRQVIRSGLTPGASLTITPQYNLSSAGAIGTVTRVSGGQLIVEPMPG
ncbi:hypothetical protein [Streptomyces sp. NPDC048445]|uniref:hypothetical protein n=1 Tax=Streptomyces sp. NPDC048445 TaxID=3365553 RepID=UPI00371F3A36